MDEPVSQLGMIKRWPLWEAAKLKDRKARNRKQARLDLLDLLDLEGDMSAFSIDTLTVR